MIIEDRVITGLESARGQTGDTPEVIWGASQRRMWPMVKKNNVVRQSVRAWSPDQHTETTLEDFRVSKSTTYFLYMSKKPL